MTYSDIPRIFSMAAVWLLMLAWQSNAYRSNGTTTLALLVVFTLLLFAAGSEVALFQRRVFLEECLEPRGALFEASKRRRFLLGVELFKGALLALLLMVGALRFNAGHWSLLFADVLLLGLLLPRFYGTLKGQMRDEYRFTTARRWAMWVSTLLLGLQSIMILVFQAGQDVGGLRWQEAITYGAVTPDIRFAPVAAVAALVGAIDVLGEWSAQNLARSLNDMPQALMASISLVASISLSFTFAYAYSLALIGAVSRPWTMWPLNPRVSD